MAEGQPHYFPAGFAGGKLLAVLLCLAMFVVVDEEFSFSNHGVGFLLFNFLLGFFIYMACKRVAYFNSRQIEEQIACFGFMLHRKVSTIEPSRVRIWEEGFGHGGFYTVVLEEQSAPGSPIRNAAIKLKRYPAFPVLGRKLAGRFAQQVAEETGLPLEA